VLTVPALLEKHGVAPGLLMLLLIDTEGFDCRIVLSLTLTALRGCPLILFEHVHCANGEKALAKTHLTGLGYACAQHNIVNTRCSKDWSLGSGSKKNN
jgi:hypothetical protein